MPEPVFDQSCDTGVSPIEAGRALMPLTLRPRPEPCPAIQPDARFVVQLIANANAETLAQRHAVPEDVATTYSDVSVRERRMSASGVALARVA
jgi:hypothetical protein